MIFGYFTLAVALLIELVGAYYSITGLAAIFSGAIVPILIMGGILETGKVTAAVWLKMYWTRASLRWKLYLVPAVAGLMVLTSMGIFGFLSKAHNDQTLVSGDVVAKIAIYDEKIKIERENVDANRKALKQLDEAVDQVMGRSTSEQGADKAVAIRKAQQKERSRLQSEITESQKRISALNEERAPIAAEVRKVEAEVGPIKYIAALVYGDNPDANILEKAVIWVILLIVSVFDPLALVLILAAQQTLRWEQKLDVEEDEPNVAANEYDTTQAPPPPQTNPVIVPEIFPEFDLDHINRMLEEAKEEVEPEVVEFESQPTTGTDAAVETISGDATSPQHFGLDYVEPDTKAIEIDDIPSQLDDVERPGDYLTSQRVLEAAPGHNRGVMYSATADNVEETHAHISKADFGDVFPTNPTKGDTYLRIDSLPNRLFKFNGNKWIEIDKDSTDSYAYNEKYIKHLVEQIQDGRYDPDLLTDVEREQIQQYIKDNN